MEITADQLECARLAASVLCRNTGRHMDFDDFFQVASLAVVENAGRYDPSKGASERHWLTSIAKYRIVDHIRDEMGRKPGSMRTNESPFSPIHDPDDGYWSPFDRVDENWDSMYGEIEDDDETVRALTWAMDVLAEELPPNELLSVQAWMACGRLKLAGQLLGKSESWVCLCVQHAERVLEQRRLEVVGEGCYR